MLIVVFPRRSIAIDAGAGRWIAGVRTDRGSRRRCRRRPSHPPTSPSELFRYHRRCEGAGDIVLVVLLLWSLQRARATAMANGMMNDDEIMRDTSHKI